MSEHNKFDSPLGRRVWEAGFVERLVRPVVVGIGDVLPSGMLLGVQGVANQSIPYMWPDKITSQVITLHIHDAI